MNQFLPRGLRTGLFCIFGRGIVEPGFPNSFVIDFFPSLLVLEGGVDLGDTEFRLLLWQCLSHVKRIPSGMLADFLLPTFCLATTQQKDPP